MRRTATPIRGLSPKPVPLVFVSASAVDVSFPGQPGSSGKPASPRIFTVFHLLVLLGILAGIALGWTVGGQLFGSVGNLAGVVVGGYGGFFVGRFPEF